MPPLATGKRRKYRRSRRRSPCARRQSTAFTHLVIFLPLPSPSLSFLSSFFTHSFKAKDSTNVRSPNANPLHKQTPCSAIPISDLDRESTTCIFSTHHRSCLLLLRTCPPTGLLPRPSSLLLTPRLLLLLLSPTSR